MDLPWKNCSKTMHVTCTVTLIIACDTRLSGPSIILWKGTKLHHSNDLARSRLVHPEHFGFR